MSIQSVTANAQPAPVVQPAGKSSAQPEVKAGTLPPETPKRTESTTETRSSNREESEKAVREAVDNIQKFVAQSTRDITFSIDQDAGFMVKVIDRTSQDVIRQIPSEEVVAIAQALDKLQGLFVRDKI
ncbi:MAG TPA: flagellar protein FlaG [Azonexus sp.]